MNPEDNLVEFGDIGEEDLDYFEKEIKMAANEDRGVVVNCGGTSLGDIALVPGPSLKYPKGIRDIQEWYMSILIRRDYIYTDFEKQTDIALRNLQRLNDRCGGLIDVVFLCGTDFGTQNSQFYSEEVFRSLYLPYYKKMNGWIKQNSGWKIFKHSCGAIVPLLDPIIESGFDIINPVQCSAEGMDPVLLKEKSGVHLTFWGGGVDTQNTLPFLTPDEVYREVIGRCEIFSRGGGFVFNEIHNVQAETPVENIVAMIDAVNDFN